MIPTPIRKLTSPMTIKIEGKQCVFNTRDAIIDRLRSLERAEISLNQQAAEAAFVLGQALLEVKTKLQYGAINHLYNEAGINRRRAQRAVRWAQEYAAKDGSFDLEKYRQGELLARNRHDDGSRPCKFDREGNPSLTAVQEAVGIRAPDHSKNNTMSKSDRPVAGGFNPMSMLNDAGAEYQDSQKNKEPAGSFRIAEYAGTSGEQLSLDFDLRVTEQRLALVINDADQAYTAGDISDEQAAAINEAMERFTDQVRSITQHNQQTIHNRATH